MGGGGEDRPALESKGVCRMGEMDGSSPGASPGQPIGKEEVLLDVIHQGAPHFLHHLEDSFKVVKLQAVRGGRTGQRSLTQ